MSTEKKLRDIAAKLDETTEKLGGTSDLDDGTQVGYTEDDVEDRAQQAADGEGVTLYRSPDGSHTAIDQRQRIERGDR